jgi:nucleotide-binding universal stress UspA family protein
MRSIASHRFDHHSEYFLRRALVEMDLTPQLPDWSARLGETDPRNVVVVGVDASESSWDAFWWSCGEAKRSGGRIVAVYVSPIGGAGSAMAVAAALMADTSTIQFDWGEKAANDVAEEIRRKLTDAASDAAVDLEFVHAKGDPAAELLRIAAIKNADLIVVGKSLKVLHYFAGSLGRRIVGKRNAPVVVVVP